MFPAHVYIERRDRLRRVLQSGILMFLGNTESPINYLDNHYPFRQDSSFLYFWGIDLPGLVGLIDIDANREILFGRDLSLEEKVWTGPEPTLQEHGLKSGVKEVSSLDQLEGQFKKAIQKGRTIHFLPQYRSENRIRIHRWLGADINVICSSASEPFIKAVVAQRSIKSKEEIEQIEKALEITCDIQMLAMRMSRPGVNEREVVGAMTGLVYSKNGGGLAFPVIFSVDGEVLHNRHHNNVMQAGDMVVNDSGAESSMHYASDITRTIPVSGTFTQQQKEIYTIVLDAQEKAIEAVAPGVEYRNVHFMACRQLTSGLKLLGLFKGDVDSAVSAGAHALFMPAGLGHMMGLDVHDMEDLGEDYVGYTDRIRRSNLFGTSRLRLARALEPGFVITVEPGLYFIPGLIDQWRAERKFEEFIDYKKLEAYRDFGGIRIEDDVLVLKDGCRVLGKPIPKSITDVEAISLQCR